MADKEYPEYPDGRYTIPRPQSTDWTMKLIDRVAVNAFYSDEYKSLDAMANQIAARLWGVMYLKTVDEAWLKEKEFPISPRDILDAYPVFVFLKDYQSIATSKHVRDALFPGTDYPDGTSPPTRSIPFGKFNPLKNMHLIPHDLLKQFFSDYPYFGPHVCDTYFNWGNYKTEPLGYYISGIDPLLKTFGDWTTETFREKLISYFARSDNGPKIFANRHAVFRHFKADMKNAKTVVSAVITYFLDTLDQRDFVDECYVAGMIWLRDDLGSEGMAKIAQIICDEKIKSEKLKNALITMKFATEETVDKHADFFAICDVISSTTRDEITPSVVRTILQAPFRVPKVVCDIMV